VTTGTTLSSEGLDPRRRRLLFRCWHRGIREMDLVLGRFADAQLASLADRELDELEPQQMEALLADTVLKEFKLRLGRIGIEYQTPARP